MPKHGVTSAVSVARWSVWFGVRLPSCQSDARRGDKGREREGPSLLKSQIDATVIRTVTSKNSRSLCCTSSGVTAQQSLHRLTWLKIKAVDGEALFLV